MGGFFPGELLQAADSGKSYARSQSERVEITPTPCSDPEVVGDRRRPDRGLSASSAPAEKAGPSQGGRRRTWDRKTDHGAPGVPGASTVLQCGGEKKLCPANPCAGVEFPVILKGLFRPHYMTWSEQTKIEEHAPAYLRNVIRIITETGLRVYKELAPMKKEQVDLANKVVFIADSKTPTGVAEVPLTDIARRSVPQPDRTRRPWALVISQRQEADRVADEFQEDLGAYAPESGCPLLPALRSPLHVRHPAECGRRGRRVGDAAASADGRQGVQEVLADEVADEARGADQAQPQGQRTTARSSDTEQGRTEGVLIRF